MTQPGPSSQPRTPRVAVIGSGFAGLCMGIRLKQAGIHSFTIFEQGSSLGGTWRDNHYPGAGCDVQSHVYSFSFEPNPKWSRMFAPQAEIREYMEHCASKYGMLPHIRLEHKVLSAELNERTRTWTVTVEHAGVQEQHEVDLVCSATGFLNRPQYPDVPGLGAFEGTLFHSSQWRHDYELDGKTVAVIGTGASAIQFVPKIAPRVAKLKLFQRTPPWIVPKPDRAIGPFEMGLLQAAPLLVKLYRFILYWLLELRAIGFVVRPTLMQFPQKVAQKYLDEAIADPELRRKLQPNFAFGCKRVLISNDYYPALTRANVDVIDTGIREITSDAVVTNDGTEHKVDAVILGTGFQSADAFAPFAIKGRGGLSLADAWSEGAEAYFGTTVARFPNFFMIVGPNTGLGHNSMIFMIESQVGHIMECIAAMQEHGASWIEVREDVQRDFNQQLRDRLGRTIWASGCGSWYLNKNGRNTTLWPGFTFRFRMQTRRLRAQDYRLSTGD